MKKRVALPIIITSGVLAFTVIAVIVLSVVFVNPLKNVLGGYESVSLYNGDTASYYPSNDNTVAKMNEGVEGTKFSVMHAILEGRFSYSPKFKTEKDESGNDVKSKLTVAGVRNLSPEDGKKMLLFAFSEKKTISVQGEEVTFDRAKVLVYDTSGEIERIEIYPYLREKLDVTPIDSYYYCYPIVIWATTGKLMDAVGDYTALLK